MTSMLDQPGRMGSAGSRRGPSHSDRRRAVAAERCGVGLRLAPVSRQRARAQPAHASRLPLRTGWPTSKSKTRRGASRPSGQASCFKSGRRNCRSLLSAPIRPPLRERYRRKTWDAGSSPRAMRRCCCSSGRGPRFGLSERRKHRAPRRPARRGTLSSRARIASPVRRSAGRPYLDHLPDDGSSELDDGTAARIDDSVDDRR